MRQNPRFVFLGSILLAASLWVAFTPAASQALAASTSPARTSAPASARATLTRLVQSVQISAMTHVATAPDTTFCTSAFSEEQTTSIAGIVLIWYKLTTKWCYDDVTVVSHTTTLSEGITTTGAIDGWSFVQFLNYHFNCYIAAGSTRQCSGNHEDGEAEFSPPSGGSCTMYLGEDENYLGKFFPDSVNDRNGC